MKGNAKFRCYKSIQRETNPSFRHSKSLFTLLKASINADLATLVGVTVDLTELNIYRVAGAN